MSKKTAIQLLRESIDSEVKLGTKMVINWDMYLAMEREQIVIAHESGYSNVIIDRGKDGLTYYNETYVNKEIEEIKSEFVCQMKDCPHCAYEEQERYEAALEKDAAVEFAKWLAQDWMAIWVVDKWMWENVDGLASKNYKHNGMYYTEEELYELCLKSE